jgi:hypothetical protein
VFEVVETVLGCGRFVAYSAGSYSVADAYSSIPSVGTTGRGHITSLGTQAVILNNSSCSLYVTNWYAIKKSASDAMKSYCGIK